MYGQLVATTDRALGKEKKAGKEKKDKDTQHVGFGRQLMEECERMAARRGYTKLAVIAGIGTRNYYRKLGYELEGDGGFMIKHLRWTHPYRLLRLALLLVCALAAALLLAAVALWNGHAIRV